MPGASQAVASIGLTEPVDSTHAPYATNDSERLVFRQVYETLVRVDCHGVLRPALAASWRSQADGRTWVITLRAEAHFADGSAVTPSDVQASWRDAARDALRPRIQRLVESVTPLDDRSLAITLRNAGAAEPRTLAHPDLVVAKAAADSQWPLGTSVDRAALERSPHNGATSGLTIARGTLPPLTFLIAAGDARDLLDRGVDLLLTRDAATLAYAATLPQFQAIPLDWQQTHVLVAPRRARTTRFPDNLRDALARDAVRGEARGAVPPFWWHELSGCAAPFAIPRDMPTLVPRLVYDARDGVAREVAERLVALARSAGTPGRQLHDALLPDAARQIYQRATGMSGDAFSRALRLGADAGYILSLERRPIDSCHEFQALLDRTPWLEADGIVPLVDARIQAVVRRERGGVAIDGDGGLRFAGAAPREP